MYKYLLKPTYSFYYVVLVIMRKGMYIFVFYAERYVVSIQSCRAAAVKQH